MGSAVLACFLSPVTGPAAWLLFDPMAWPRLSPDFCHLTWTMTRPQSVSPLLSLVSRHRAALWMKRLDGEESGLHRLILASPPAPERQLCGPAPNPRPREQPGSKRRRPQAQLPSFRADRCWGHICVVTGWTQRSWCGRVVWRPPPSVPSVSPGHKQEGPLLTSQVRS